MKNLILILASLFFYQSANAALDANPECSTELEKHIELMKVTNETFKSYIAEKNTELTAYQITNFEHEFTSRIKHLNVVREAPCELNSLRELIISSDYISVGKSLIADFKMRRIVALLIKTRKDDFKNYRNEYKSRTKKVNLESQLNNLKNENQESLVESINLDLDISGIKPLTTISDVGVKGLTGALATFAILWGKLSDATVWREGHLKNNQEALTLLKANLKPFDLIYESRDYTLSHLTIPGHFGHVAIWMGTKEELIALGVWDQDYIAPFREQIELGKSIIELRKPGVQFVDLQNFINLDEIAVTRINDIEKNAESIFKNLNLQFGKKYDYTFNAHTSNKITCAELIAYSYGDIKWPNLAKASVVNLRPDDLAIYTLLNESKSEFVLYLKGNKDSKTFESFNYEGFKALFR